MSDDGPLPGFDDRAPRDRYCDLILTGGVTSAIAYPAAIFALATAYRFNCIGGSSSGAGAAALAAAAEYRRRHGSSDGFRILLQRTADLANKVDGRTGLAWLFQPEEKKKRLFNVLVPGFAMPDDKIKHFACGLARAYALPILGGIAAASALVAFVSDCCAPQGFLAYGFTSLFGAIVALGVALGHDVARIVIDGDYGLCTGMKPLPDTRHPPLVEFLHNLIQEIAGRHQDAPPLTFADLAAAPGSPKETLGDLSLAGSKSIGLQMFTANVTHGRPYVLPQEEEKDDDEGEPQLYFRESEMLRLFPRTVVEHMMVDPITRESNLYTGKKRRAARAAPGAVGRVWLRLKGNSQGASNDDEPMWLFPRKHLPIVVAARMSVSFPFLFTAVPLWTLDSPSNPRDFTRCLFSDGSLCSNFPIHLFDSPLPRWPTFGISLYQLPERFRPAKRVPPWDCTDFEERNEDIKRAVELPEDHRKGGEDRLTDVDQRPRAHDRLFGFVSALFSTVIDWNDKTLARLPGVRDRVARVGLMHGIGGLNIFMTGPQIRFLAELGYEAARRLLDRFAKVSSGSGDTAEGWNEHRWVRFNLLRDCLSNTLEGLTSSAAQSRYAKPLREQIRSAIDEGPLKEAGDSPKLLAAQAAALDGVLAALIQAERVLAAPSVKQPYKPYPQPVLRIRPRL